MGTPLRALIVEDVEADAQLVLRELRRGGFEVTSERVDTPEAMAAALDAQRWDLIISDYTLPRFDAPGALAMMKGRNLDLPFIIVSGTIGEEIAVGAIRAGAHDFMTKGQFARLVPAIQRELRDAGLRVERARLQEQLLLSDRMASVGTLAAGVAHEINNPLAALMANLQLVAGDVATLAQEASSDAHHGPAARKALLEELGSRLATLVEPLRDANECADRIRFIVRDLKVFSRADEERRVAVDVRPVLESALRIAGNELRYRARVVTDFGDVPSVHANESRLGQVFLNLIVNAAQAMPEGRVAENQLRVVTRTQGDELVVVEVHDTGCGIPPDHLPRIFDPFFTTKPIGVGTGLGLAICRRLVTELGGRIEVESTVGEGTVFRTLLPILDSAPALSPTFSAIAPDDTPDPTAS